MSPGGLRRLALLSVVAALVTIGLKSAAYFITGSVGLLSDALESGVNLVAALTAYLTLRYAHRPVDSSHTYGHQKIEYFSSGLEGALIIVAGIGTGWIAIRRMVHPAELSNLALGTAIALGASVINLVVGMILLRAGRQHHSIVLEADGKHLLTDVWTSVGVVGGLFVVWATGISVLDPILALLVGANIIWTGWTLVRRSFDGLMDHALSPADLEKIRTILRDIVPAGSTYHALRSRQAGTHKFADFHLLVPGSTCVRDGHELAYRVEKALEDAIPHLQVTIHLEPIEEPVSYEDNTLRHIENEGQ